MDSSNRKSYPRHIAIIMDGNGRWAQTRKLPRLAGHRKGAEVLEKVVRGAKDLGVEYLTLFAFSIENWSRPEKEVTGLMSLLRRYLKSETSELHKNGARLKVIGDRSRLDEDILRSIEHLEDLTKDNTDITVVIALSYGARQEIAQAAKQIALKVQSGEIDPNDIDPDMVASHLMTSDIPDPDLIIRTSGENRLSNFLLWQAGYAEFYFTPVFWPDFSADHLKEACESYAQRDRRFGKIKEIESTGHV